MVAPRLYCALASVFLVLSCSTANAGGLTKAQVAKLGKSATVFLDLPSEKASASAFCIHPNGYFITNAHTVRGASNINLVLHPGEKGQRILKAKVLRSDAALDLALLHVEGQRTWLRSSWVATSSSPNSMT